MRLIHYLEIENFKRFGDRQRIALDHPAVLIGPNNCGKTTAIQALALWSQAVRTWFEAKGKSRPKERPATSINRLNIVSVPVRRTRYFWHDAVVRRGARDVPLTIGVGVLHGNAVERVTMRFRNQGDELVYCAPDDATRGKPEVIRTAAALNVRLLYPMSGIETEEPILRPGRIDVLLGQGQTAQVLRNLCLLVFRDAPDDWRRIAGLMERLFSVELGDPTETARGGIDLAYRQADVREPLDVALAGRGLQQMLLLLAYLHSHPRSVLLIDEPDAHLEILRQKQVYALLREIAARNESQVVLVTHSEVLIDEALDRNLTLLSGGRAEDLTARPDVRSALRRYHAAHYVRAVDVVNERFGTEFTSADQLFFDQVVEAAVADALRRTAAVNAEDRFGLVFRQLVEGFFVERMDQNEEIFVRYMNDAAFRGVVTDWLSSEAYRRLGAGAADAAAPDEEQA